jgi:hypothetical protein
MNPDVLITIAFAAISVMVALVPLVLVVPRARREGERVRHESEPQSQAKPERGAAVH